MGENEVYASILVEKTDNKLISESDQFYEESRMIVIGRRRSI